MAKHALKGIDVKISALERQVKALHAKRRALSVREILSLMRAHGIAVEDVLAAYRDSFQTLVKSNAPQMDGRFVVAAKYRDPETGKTWTGRGVPPRWLTAAESRGVSRGDFLIDMPPPRQGLRVPK